MSRDSTEKPANPSISPAHVVILGSGFAGNEVLKKAPRRDSILIAALKLL